MLKRGGVRRFTQASGNTQRILEVTPPTWCRPVWGEGSIRGLKILGEDAYLTTRSSLAGYLETVIPSLGDAFRCAILPCGEVANSPTHCRRVPSWRLSALQTSMLTGPTGGGLDL